LTGGKNPYQNALRHCQQTDYFVMMGLVNKASWIDELISSESCFMNIRWVTVFFIISVCILTFCKNKVSEPDQDNNSSGPRFEPPDGECLFILGQANNTAMEAYINEVITLPLPAGFAYYTSLSNGAIQNDMPRYKAFLDKYPNTVLQLAIWTGERQWGPPGYYLKEIIQGRYDMNIDALAYSCQQLHKPVFIRFGYEFDGWHNAYPPDQYITAYRYFVDKMRDFGVDNVAYVWHSCGVDAYYGDDDFPDYYPPLASGQPVTQELWYPGDDYVDWLAISIFGIGWGNLGTNDVVQWFVHFADKHAKPLMIAESAAIKTTGSSDPDWVIPNTRWFEQVFHLCQANNAFKAFTYINVDWEAGNGSSTWGDTQVQHAPNVIDYWKAQIQSFLHADENLYSLINYP
jgi:hypothetical protein